MSKTWYLLCLKQSLIQLCLESNSRVITKVLLKTAGVTMNESYLEL